MKVIGFVAVALVLGACSFDRGGLGARGSDVDVIDAATPDGATTEPLIDGAPGVPDARLPIDATPVPPDATLGVACGAATCATQQVCCVSFGGGGQQLDCSDNCGGGDLTYECDGPEDCGGDDCCLAGSGGGSTCRSSCNFGQQLTCRSDGDCPSSQTCCPANIGNISVCRAICF